MKQHKNNEIDLLLRSLARGERRDSPFDMDRVSAREDGVLSDHLDADELNSFAEGLVTAPARTRYVAHLADCESCRGLVVYLTQASGVAARSETLEQQSGAGFWQKVGAFFSPPVLRYAVPVLALTAVIAISFFALRQQRRADLVAKNEPTNSAASAYPKEQHTESPAAQLNIEAPAKTRNDAEPRSEADSSSYKTSSEDRKRLDEAPATTVTDARTESSLKDSAQSKQGYVAGAGAAQPPFAPEPVATPPPPPKPALSAADKAGALRKEEPARREVQALPVEEEKNQPRDQVGRHGPSRNETMRRTPQADGLMTERGETRAKAKKDSDDEAETRTILGKSFRLRGNAWIDTAFDSSRRTINVSRGSEQFRALTADEPEIRIIAEKLNGVVIVVWNGKAYRIQ